jgi:hypothetical protein
VLQVWLNTFAGGFKNFSVVNGTRSFLTITIEKKCSNLERSTFYRAQVVVGLKIRVLPFFKPSNY